MSNLESISISSTEELSAVLSDVCARRTPVVPCGGGTHQHIGAQPQDSSVSLHLTRLNGLTFHEPADLVASFRAGTRLDEVQRILSQRGQHIALDPAAPNTTLGGALAVDHRGLRSTGWGTLRDLVLGMTFVLADGRVIRTGGRVVKNVAGYDLSKLLIGSLGTLGILTEIVVRLHPLPEQRIVFLEGHATLDTALERVRVIRSSSIEPTALALARLESSSPWPAPDGASRGPWTLLVGVEGNARRVEAHREWLASPTKAKEACELDDRESEQLYRRWGLDRCGGQETPILARFGLSFSDPRPILSRIADDPGVSSLVAEPTIGQGWIALTDRSSLLRIRGLLEQRRGYCVAWRSTLKLGIDEIWGTPRTDFALMRQIKEIYDPHRILNRGRFLGGL